MLRRIIRRLIRGGSTPTPASSSRTPATPPVSAPELDDEPEDLVDVEVDTEGLKTWVSSGAPFTLVDIREPHELRLGYARDALLLRMNDIPNRLDELPSKETRLSSTARPAPAASASRTGFASKAGGTRGLWRAASMA